MTKEQQCYNDWRRSEAYQVPMTEEGIRLANERYEQFKVGYYYGQRRVYFEIEQEHRLVKHLHKFYLVLLDKLRK